MEAIGIEAKYEDYRCFDHYFTGKRNTRKNLIRYYNMVIRAALFVEANVKDVFELIHLQSGGTNAPVGKCELISLSK